MPVWLLWLVAAVGLAGAEALTGDLFLLMLGGGALAAVGSSLLFDNYVIDGVVFLVVSLLLLVLVRPALRRRFAAGTGLPEPMKALEGKSALVLDRVARHEGQVKLDGEVWTARPLNDDDVFEAGDHVTIMRIDGATAVVFKTI
jgi:membrane protein implicated in regulation of membrane protease activity